MKKLLTLVASMAAFVSVSMAQSGTYTGSVSVMVGAAYGPYTNDSVSYVISQNADSTLNVTINGYSLAGTYIGDLTLGGYTVSNIAYDEAKGGYYRDYTNDGLSMHFQAVSGGRVIMDSDYTFEKNGGKLQLTPVEGGYTIVNTFQPGAMPFGIVATANVVPSTSALRTLEAQRPAGIRYDLQGRRTTSTSGFLIESGKLILRR